MTETTIKYRNHRGEIATRLIQPMHLWFGSTPWHTTNQWHLRVFDNEKNETRDFACSGILAWGTEAIEAYDAQRLLLPEYREPAH